MKIKPATHLSQRPKTIVCAAFLLNVASMAYAEEQTIQPNDKAETAQKSAASEDNSVFELGEVTVTATPTGILDSRDILSSVDIMNADKIADQNVLTSFDLLHRMPGVQITQFNQGITTGKFSFRAFNGEGNINAVKLLIDGIPSNNNAGDPYFIDSLFPLDIESIETVRGTNDPRYGLHAIAGNANIRTFEGGNYAKGRVSYGSFDTTSVQSGAGYEKNGFTQNYTADYRYTNGYRAHAQSDKDSFSGKWFYSPEDGKYKVGLIARYSYAEAQEPGYLTFEESRDNPTQSRPHNKTDGGNRELAQLSGHFDFNLTNDLSWSTKSYVNIFNDQRWVTFSAPTAPGTSNQQERLNNEVQYGAITSLTWRPKVDFLDDFSTEAGFDIQQQDNKNRRWRGTVDRVRQGDPSRDQDYNFYTYGGYLTTLIQPFKWLRFTPGFRVDRVGGDSFKDFGSSPAFGGSGVVNNYGTIWQPKISAVITPIEGYSLYGNWGRTFQVGVASGTFKANSAPNSPVSINEGWEIGIKAKPVDWAEGRIAYWEQTATNEISRNLATFEASNLGSTARRGADFQVNIKPVDPVSVWATYSIQEAIVVQPEKGSAASVGNQIINTPDYVFSAGLDYQITPELKTSLWTTGQGDYHTDDANKLGQFGEYALLNLDIGYQVNKWVDLQFQAKNLTDTYWEYVWNNGGTTMHSPGDGRAFYGAININYDL
ncbi:MAG: TonB-dependent receptor [Methyloglobulus sp.]|nr:TonB-dependent receptor [Methyloglobulus sp.]